MVTTAEGYPRHEAAKVMVHDAVQVAHNSHAAITVAAEMGQAAQEFSDALEEIKVSPKAA